MIEEKDVIVWTSFGKMIENEVQITEVLALSYLLAQGQNMASLQAIDVSEEIFSSGGQMVYRSIQEAAQRQPKSMQALFDQAPKDLHPLISELKELGEILYSQAGSATPAHIKTWIKEGQC